MLTYVLALVVVLASLGLYSATFMVPEVSRKNDLVWSRSEERRVGKEC